MNRGDKMLDIVKKYYLVVIGVIILCVFIIANMNDNENEMIFDPILNEEIVEEVKFIYIDLKGEVKNPGVYKIEDSSRLFQVISLAGGTTMDADVLAFNLSLRLRDEQVIYIPSIYDEYPMITEINENAENGIVNINTASLQELDTLPGIGPTTAQSIIDYRNENGDFSNIDDLISVPGVGEATLNEIREFIIT
jgi:competence protein ComEA